MRSRYLLLLPLLVMLAAVALVMASSQKLSVQVKTGQLRSTPSFLGTLVANLAYGDRVTLIKQQDPWYQVRDDKGHTGWIHRSAVTQKHIIMTAGQQDAQTSASGEELALAGKGFNSDVEAKFKQDNKDIDFTWVDKMEQITVTPQESASFLAEGQVTVPEGGAK
jgi:uncharacterized protein YgiM (DUF1202 family)